MRMPYMLFDDIGLGRETRFCLFSILACATRESCTKRKLRSMRIGIKVLINHFKSDGTCCFSSLLWKSQFLRTSILNLPGSWVERYCQLNALNDSHILSQVTTRKKDKNFSHIYKHQTKAYINFNNREYQTNTMVNDLSFSTYSEVMHSWERIRCIKDYDKTLGVLIFSK